MSELTCPGCGKQLTEYTRFCPECGARMPEPAAVPPAAPPTPPPGGLRTVVIPPAELLDPAAPPVAAPPVAAEAGPAPAPSAIPPTTRLDPPAPLPYAMGEGAGQPPAQGRRTLWWIIGGVGCLTVLLIGACVSIGALTLLGQQVANETGNERATPGAGGVILEGATPAAGVILDEGPLGGNAVRLEDDFSDPSVSNLNEYEDETSRSAYEDGAFVLEVKVPEMVVWVLIGGPYGEISAEVEAAWPQGAEITSAGLVFHYQDDENFYLFTVANDGYYTLELLQNGEWVTLIDPTLSDEINSERNTLRVETSGEQIALYVNGVLLEETIDGSFTSGEVGLSVSTFENSTGTVRFDNLVVAGIE